MRQKPLIMGLAHWACVRAKKLPPLRLSILLEPGALKQVEQTHGGLTDMHARTGKYALQAQDTRSVTFLRNEKLESNLESKWRQSAALHT